MAGCAERHLDLSARFQRVVNRRGRWNRRRLPCKSAGRGGRSPWSGDRGRKKKKGSGPRHRTIRITRTRPAGPPSPSAPGATITKLLPETTSTTRRGNISPRNRFDDLCSPALKYFSPLGRSSATVVAQTSSAHSSISWHPGAAKFATGQTFFRVVITGAKKARRPLLTWYPVNL